MDLSELELTDELREQILQMHQSEINGLVAKRDELLSETKESKAQAKATAEALQKAEEERLKLAGDIDGLKAHYEKINAENLALVQSKADLLVQRDKSEMMNSILSAVEPQFREFTKASLESQIQVSHNADGQPVYQINAGGKVVESRDEFLSWAKEQDSWKSVLTGAKTSGAGTQQSNTPSASLSKQEMIRQKYGLNS